MEPMVWRAGSHHGAGNNGWGSKGVECIGERLVVAKN